MTDPRETAPPVTGNPGAPAPRRRRGRAWLYGPYLALAVMAVLWSLGWLYVRHRAGAEIDAFLAREAAAGRTWTCPGRTIGGYPFRIELRCEGVTFARADLTWQVGPVVAVAQVYDLGHAIVEATGPLRLKEGSTTLDADWRQLQASFHAALSGFQRASLVVEGPKGTVEGVVLGTAAPGAPTTPPPAGAVPPVPAPPPPEATPVPVTFAAEHLEVHGRPTPGRFEAEGAVDVSARLQGAMLPLLDPVLGSSDPAAFTLDATMSRARGFGARPLPLELERWRGEGGGLDVTALSLAKGERRIQARGRLGLDDAHRLTGDAQLRAAGVEALVASVMGQRFGAERGALIGNLVGGLLNGLARPRGGAAAIEQGGGGDPGLKPLPPLRLADGRVFLGPLAIPNLRLVPLY